MPQVGPSHAPARHPHRNDATTPPTAAAEATYEGASARGSRTAKPPLPLLFPHAPELASGGELRRLRVARGFSRRELAEQTGYSQWTIRDWETGRIRSVPASFAPLLWDVLDQVNGHLAADRARFQQELRDAEAG